MFFKKNFPKTYSLKKMFFIIKCGIKFGLGFKINLQKAKN